MNELALFAGAGGGILGGKLLGWKTVCAVEWDAYARDVLVARQNDGCLPPFPIWDDIQTFDGRPWRGSVDVVSGGFPCQDISTAGKGAGIDGKRSGMWAQMRRVIGEVRPRFVFVENSPALTTRGGVRVTGDLASLGYVGCNGVLGAADAIWASGTPIADHLRNRIWFVGKDADSNRHELRQQPEPERGSVGAPLVAIDGELESLAHAESQRRGKARELRRDESAQRSTCAGKGERQMADAAGDGREQGRPESARRQGGSAAVERGGEMADADRAGLGEQRRALADDAEHSAPECGGWWESEPDVGRVAHGVAARVDRLRCIGNGQVPAVVKLAWETLT